MITEIDIIKKKIRQLLNDLADDIAGGAAHDFAEYRHMTGIVHGLALVEREILDLEKVQDKDD
jgi:hypothetical protein